ncbi:unnamed protein product [Kuraishia capsulata CBS 1993]|uniref:Fe2OG dioxygenase domain-containing protein n=1 Tax=Kuraishia capsulata CBS 1993 TaxID=1382522 RepID=W6MP40_9ASCO|nr:uncharacterized protein KUCA_T00004383001 [Kuraishia capsulata CBS 1993]CDK28401.1 unnamed protein product [Kuraishia capsulata CBS 1993]
MLTETQLRQFQTEGCVTIPGALLPETVTTLLQESKRMIAGLDLESHPMTKFNTGDDEESHVGDDYFLNSSDKVSFFFEPDAIDKNGRLVREKETAINKIGHGLHFLNSEFNKATINGFNAAIASQIGFSDPRVLQSMVICKQPSIGGKVPSHQDAEFLYTQPQSCVGFWFALEDCTLENGCLSYVPGSHFTAPIVRRFVSGPAGTKFINPNTGQEWEGFTEQEQAVRENESLFKTVEIPAGTLVLIHSNLIHKSERNTSAASRYAYTFHVIEGESEYDAQNWLQIPPNKPSGSLNFTSLRVS